MELARKDPRKLKRVPIKEELVALTGDYIKAVLLQQFIYWSERVSDFDTFIQEENKRLDSHGFETVELTGGWIYKSAEELSEETMLGMAGNTIRRHLKVLVEKGYLAERRNPKYNWDRTLQYRVDLLQIQIDLMELGYPLEGYSMEFPSSKMEHYKSKMEDYKSKMESLNLQNGGTIPEITTDITSEITTEVGEATPSPSIQTLEEKASTESGKEGLPTDEEQKAAGEGLVRLKGMEVPSKVISIGGGGSNENTRDSGDLDGIVKEVSQRTKEIRKVKMERKKNRPRKPAQNANTIVSYFGECFKDRFGGVPPLELEKDRALMKKMIEHYGYDMVVELIDWLFGNYAEFARDCKITGVPTIGMFFGFRGYLHEKILYTQESSVPDEGDSVW